MSQAHRVGMLMTGSSNVPSTDFHEVRKLYSSCPKTEDTLTSSAEKENLGNPTHVNVKLRLSLSTLGPPDVIHGM